MSSVNDLPGIEPRPVDAAVAEEWRAFFAGGGVFAVPVERELIARRMRGSTTLLAALILMAVAVVAVAIWLLMTDGGRELTYVLLALLLVLTGFAGARIVFLRRRVQAAYASPDEYLAIRRDGLRFSGVDFLWSEVLGGLVMVDDQQHGGLKRLTAKIMSSAGYARTEIILGLQHNLARERRKAASPAVRKAYFVNFEAGGMRIPLEHVLAEQSIPPVCTALRVAAADAGVPIVISSEPAVIQSTVFALYRGRTPGAGKEQ